MRMLRRQAFTMIEILIVFVVIGILAALLLPRVYRLYSRTKVKATEMTLNAIKGALVEYQLDMQKLPDQREGLKVLLEKPSGKGSEKWRGPYYEGELVDAWGEEIIYNKPPQRFKNKYRRYEVISLGEEREERDDNPNAGE
jgi:general secretion pathway protein G